MADPTARPSVDQQIQLKNPGWAAFLAWLWPGAGHIYQGRLAKGLLFMICILGTFFYGMYLGEGRVVFIYGPFRPEMFRLHYLCQVGAGLPALPAIVQAKFPQRELFGGWYMPPRDVFEWDDVHLRLHRYFELGSAFTMIAGLLNVLAIYDAWGGPAYSEEHEPSEAPAEQPATA